MNERNEVVQDIGFTVTHVWDIEDRGQLLVAEPGHVSTDRQTA